MTAEPADDGTAWLTGAVKEVFAAAFDAHFVTDLAAGRRAIMEALARFADTVDDNHGDDAHWFSLAVGLATLGCTAAPPGAFGDGDGPTIVQVEDTVTGEIVDDPDAEMDDAASAAGLAASRIIAAVNDGDTARALPVFAAVRYTEAAPLLVLLLAEYAAASAVDSLRRKGELSPEATAALEAKEAANPPPPAPERDPTPGAPGFEYVTVPGDERDQGDVDRVAPHGHAQYCMAPYLPGGRDAAAAAMHLHIEARHEPGELCGVRHVDDIQPWQMPHTARRQFNRELRRLRRASGREPLLLRAWQHVGACPETGGQA